MNDYMAEYAAMSKPELIAEATKLGLEIRGAEKQIPILQARVDDLKEIEEWGLGEPVLQANDTTRLHRLIQAHAEGRTYNWNDRHKLLPSELFWHAKSFVVKHDWYAAVGAQLSISDTELKLPFPLCCFEFRVSHKNVIVWCGALDNEWRAMCFIEGLSGDWYTGEELDKDTEHGKFCWEQIKAICVMLDAEVAVHEVIRAPHSLNIKRARTGKFPINEFHVVDLSRRHRVESGGGSTDRHVRLHFRRGHWRHLETHKTWIKWMLVGDPNLGFVDKRYSL